MAGEIRQQDQQGHADEYRHPKVASRQEAESDPVVAGVDELDARQQLAFFPLDDRVFDQMLGELVGRDDEKEDDSGTGPGARPPGRGPAV